MTTYYSTFVSGLQEVVRSALINQLTDVEIKFLFDGLVVYHSDRPIQKIINLRFFNNTFLLLHLFSPNTVKLGGRPIEYMMNAVLKNPSTIPGVPRWAIRNASSFRIIASIENQTEPVEKNLLTKMERFFSYRLKLKTNRSKPDVEVWFLARSEGYGFIGMRLKRAHGYEKGLQKGELRPELAHILCLISEPDKEDIFLDPFAGSGAIPIERASAFPYKQVIASEMDKTIFGRLQNKVNETKLNITLGLWDATNLESMPGGSITKIVSDPPWGIFSQPGVDLVSFYTRMLKEFLRVLQRDGSITILMGQKELFEKALSNFPRLILVEKYGILVSGKKAVIYKMKPNFP